MMKSFFKSLKYIANIIPKMISRKLISLKSVFAKKLNIKAPAKKISKDFEKKMMSFVKSKEKSKKDYLKLGKIFISKKIFIVVTLAIILLPISVIFLIIPSLEGNLWEARLIVNTSKFLNFTGKALIYDEDDNLLARGSMKNGKLNGFGRVYKDKKLIFEGNFKNGNYDAFGILRNEKGDIVYEGEFKSGKFQNEGKYYLDNNLIYIGEFDSGNFSNQGEIYKGEKLLYQGGFLNGKKDKNGTLYDIEGNLVYEGEFKTDKYSGKGKLYYPYIEKLKYEGNFKNGLESGDGVLYAKDSKILYKGNFAHSHIDYRAFLSDDISKLREAFGKEDEYFLKKTGFITKYKTLNFFACFDYAKEGVDEIPVKNIVILRETGGIEDIKIGDNISKFKAKNFVDNSRINLNLYFRELKKCLNQKDFKYYKIYKENFDIIVLVNADGTIVAIIL